MPTDGEDDEDVKHVLPFVDLADAFRFTDYTVDPHSFSSSLLFRLEPETDYETHLSYHSLANKHPYRPLPTPGSWNRLGSPRSFGGLEFAAGMPMLKFNSTRDEETVTIYDPESGYGLMTFERGAQ